MARARRAQRRCCVGRPWLPFSRFTTHARMMLTRDWRVAGAVWGRSTPAHSTTARRARSRPLSDFGRLSRLDWIRSSRTDRASRIRPGGPPGPGVGPRRGPGGPRRGPGGPAEAAAPPPSAPGILYVRTALQGPIEYEILTRTFSPATRCIGIAFPHPAAYPVRVDVRADCGRASARPSRHREIDRSRIEDDIVTHDRRIEQYAYDCDASIQPPCASSVSLSRALLWLSVILLARLRVATAAASHLLLLHLQRWRRRRPHRLTWEAESAARL